jgi:hypothetical protein
MQAKSPTPKRGVITMLRNFASFKTVSLRRAAHAVAVALIAATAFVGNTAPAAAFGFHGGSYRPHAGFGGFHHDFDPPGDNGINPPGIPG